MNNNCCIKCCQKCSKEPQSITLLVEYYPTTECGGGSERFRRCGGVYVHDYNAVSEITSKRKYIGNMMEETIIKTYIDTKQLETNINKPIFDSVLVELKDKTKNKNLKLS
jgi:hypothetical protein